MQETVLILGAKPSQGMLDNGRSYDSTKVYVQTSMGDAGSGFATVEHNWGSSENYAKIKDLEYPFEADVFYEVVTTGKLSRLIVKDIKPKKPAPNKAV